MTPSVANTAMYWSTGKRKNVHRVCKKFVHEKFMCHSRRAEIWSRIFYAAQMFCEEHGYTSAMGKHRRV